MSSSQMNPIEHVPRTRLGARVVTALLVSALALGLSGATPTFAAEREVIALTGNDLTLEDVVKIAENRADISISREGIQRIEAARRVIQHYVDAEIPAYGINTMYGQDFGVTLPPAEIKRINRLNLFQEATNMGDGSQPYLEPGIVRAAWALMVNSYAKGFSGASPALAGKLVERVNANRIPKDIEYGGSMGDADLTMNAKLALSLYEDPGFEVGPGDATNLLTSNFLTVARSVVAVKRFEQLLPRAKVSLALGVEGYRASLTPVSESAMKAATLPGKHQVQREMQFLLKDSKLWEEGGSRRLQDFLSLRTSADLLAAMGTVLDRVEPTLSRHCNALHASPMIDVETERILSVTEYDTTQLTLDMDHFRQALGLMALGTSNRALKEMSRPFTDLPSGLASDDPTKFDGLYTRNITYWLISISRDAEEYSKPVTGMTVSFMAEGDEDYSTPFPNSAWLAERLVDRLEKIVTIEALIGSYALERRLQSGELTEKDIPAPLRVVQREVIKRSPLVIPADEQYSLAPLLKYFIEEYQPPPEISR